MEINNTLMRIRETTNEINQATGDDKMKETLEKTWRLQDRLVFSNCVRQKQFCKQEFSTNNLAGNRLGFKSSPALIWDFEALWLASRLLEQLQGYHWTIFHLFAVSRSYLPCLAV